MHYAIKSLVDLLKVNLATVKIKMINVYEDMKLDHNATALIGWYVV